MALIWTAWNNGKNFQSGAGYGLKVPITDRNTHFKRTWTAVTLELPGQEGITEAQINVAKPSFWNETCHELISQQFGQWLRKNGFAPWPASQPPKFSVEVIGNRRFRVTGIAK